jgi:hypothetical protein
MTALYSDDFTRADNATDLGADWSIVRAGWKLLTNAAEATGGFTFNKLATYIPAGTITDCQVEVTAESGGTLSTAGVSFRVQDAHNWYAAYVDAEGIARIMRNLAGTITTIAQQSGIPAGDRSPVRVAMLGNAFSVYCADELVLSTTDDNFSDGDVGIYAYYYLARVGEFAFYSAPSSPGGVPASSDEGTPLPGIPDTTVHIEPVGRDSFELTLTDEPEYAEAANGGYTTARIPCILDERHRDRILDARVRIFPARGVPWIGRVATIKQSDSLAELTCTGPQADLARFRREALYCDTALTPWRETYDITRHKDIRVTSEVANLAIQWQAGVTFPIGAHNAFVRNIPPTDAVTVSFDWTRPNQTDRGLYVYSGVYDPSATSGDRTTYTTHWTQPVGSGGTSGSQTINMTGTAIDTIRIRGYTHAETTPTDTDGIGIANLKVYGVKGTAIITDITAPNVINDVCDQLPTWVLPAGTEPRAWIDTTDTTAIEPLTFGPESSELDILEDVLQYRDRELSFRSKLIAGTWQPAPVYQAKPSAPLYHVYPDFSGTLDLTGDDITSLADSVRVVYSDAEGRTVYVDVSETSLDNRLVTIAHPKRDTISASTQSSATATLIGQKYLAARKFIRVAGTLTLEGAITDSLGAEVLPCEIRAGESVRLHGTPYGTVDARITQVTKVGSLYATLTLDNTPTELDHELALLTKRQR